jgi:signal transduction histidine kinase/ligand-binding sensor domain-containing protein/DNA-binding response OmpR family regulator
MNRIFIVFLLFFAIDLSLFSNIGLPDSQNSLVWQSVNITNEDGLSNSAVISIFRDKRGYMWFGTWDGLNRYDGKNIKTFYPDLFDENAISNNIIRSMIEDTHGNMWIVTEQGINQYSYDRENFSSWFTDQPELSIRENSLKARIGHDGNVWVSAYGLGVFQFSPEKNDFQKVVIPDSGDADLKRINDFFFYENQIYILERNNLIIYDFKNSSRLVKHDISTFYTGSGSDDYDGNWFFELNGHPYLALSIRKGGLMLINLDSLQAEIFNKYDESFRVTNIQCSENKMFLWIGTDDGSLYQMKSNNGLHINSVLHLIPQLADKKVKIWSIWETSDDLLWIGTDGEGVFRSIQKPKPFFQITRGEASKRQLNHQIVRAILEDEKGNLWVGTRGNGLNMIPAHQGPTKYFTTSNGLTNNAVLALKNDESGHLWIGHDGTGIDILETNTGNFYHFPSDLKGGEDLDFGSVYDICIDAFGQVWLGTSGYGVIGLNISRENDGFHLINKIQIRGEGPDDILKSNIIYAIVEEKPNILWLATRGAGIYRLNTLTLQLENFSQAHADQPGLSDNDILSLHMGSDGNLWVGSSGGLNQVNLDFRPYAFTHFTTLDGLPNNTIHAILEDNEGNIWTSTNKGLSKFDRINNQFLNFNSADGLQSNEYTDGAAFYSRHSGKFYFGGINGLDWFYPEEIKISERMPDLLLNSLRLYNKLILPGDSSEILSRNINELEKITLKHNQNFFTIGFTTLNFINPDKCLFEYKLENFNDDWVFAGNQREASFTNVPFGKYRLMVRATNEDGVWSDEIKSLQIIIRPPFWRTWPAYLLYVVLAVGILYSIYRYQLRRLHVKQQRALEKVQQEKEKEINQYKLQFFTNLAHEFGTPLTLIFASAASLMGHTNKKEESSNLIKLIYQNSRRMQRLVQELLEFRKVDAGHERLKNRKTELVSTLNNIVEIFHHFARENELELSFEPELNELWVLTDADKIEKIMLNLLSNALKYTPAGGNVSVILEKSKDQIIIKVNDTGIGIPEESIAHIFEGFNQYGQNQHPSKTSFKGIGIGLAYTRSLAELLGGAISVKSKQESGSSFTVSLPYTPASPAEGPTYQQAGLITRSAVLENLTEEFISGKNQDSNIAKRALWTTPKKYRVLVAEDDLELSNLLFRLLSEQYDVSLAKTGKQALELIKNNRIDLLVSDIVMPEMDGLTLCKTIKSEVLTSHIPVILLTAKTEMENRIEGLEMGADSYIPKPFHPKHLFVRIEKLLKTREQISEYFKANFGTPTYDLQQNYSARDKDLLEKCVRFIENNFGEETLDAELLASHLALSKAQLYRKIKALTGLTPHGLIKNFRLKKARQMIAEGEYSITEIIYLTGFNNRTYFYRSYKEIFGETPGEINKNVN